MSAAISSDVIPGADELFQGHPVATFILSSDLVISLVNQSAETLANISRSGLIGRPLLDVIAFEPDQEQRLRGLDQRAYLAHAISVTIGHGGPTLVDMQIVAIGENGQWLLTLVPVLGAGELYALSNTGGTRSATAAASMLAHEIKNPLAGIRGAAQLIARQPGDNAVRFTDLICTEVDRIAALIDRMQHFSRGSPLSCAPTNIYPALAQAADSFRAGQGANVAVTEDFDPSIPFANANHNAIVQIVMNLLANAGDAVAGLAAPMIRISTSFRHGLLLENGTGLGRVAVPIEICVADNGPGIDPDLGDAIFEPFVTGKRDGQGLGLALVARLARDMGGAAQVRRKDGWTQFRLHLPAANNGVRADT